MSLNTLSELHMKSKTQVEYQQNLLLKKGKTITTETLRLVRNVYEDDNFSRQVPENNVLAGSKMTHCVCVCSAHQNVMLLVDAMDWGLTYKDLIKLTLSCELKFICDLFYITIIHKSIF